MLLGLDSIITARNSIQNPGQAWIFYKLGQTNLTRTRDTVGPDNPNKFQL